jgi:hypothetical protein
MDKLQVRCWIMALSLLYSIHRAIGGRWVVSRDRVSDLIMDLKLEIATPSGSAEIKFDLMSEPELSEALRSAKR